MTSNANQELAFTPTPRKVAFNNIYKDSNLKISIDKKGNWLLVGTEVRRIPKFALFRTPSWIDVLLGLLI